MLDIQHGCWPAGPRASVSVSNWSPPRPSGGGSSPSPDGSPAPPAASPCTCPSAGPGKLSSVAPWPDCAPFPYQPDGAPSAPDPSTGQPLGLSRKLMPAQPASATSGLPPGRFRRPPPLRAATLPLAWPPPTTLNPIYWNRARPVRLPVPINPRVNATAVSLRWIRAKTWSHTGR